MEEEKEKEEEKQKIKQKKGEKYRKQEVKQRAFCKVSRDRRQRVGEVKSQKKRKRKGEIVMKELIGGVAQRLPNYIHATQWLRFE